MNQSAMLLFLLPAGFHFLKPVTGLLLKRFWVEDGILYPHPIALIYKALFVVTFVTLDIIVPPEASQSDFVKRLSGHLWPLIALLIFLTPLF